MRFLVITLDILGVVVVLIVLYLALLKIAHYISQRRELNRKARQIASEALIAEDVPLSQPEPKNKESL